jgi:type I restriction enzyme S subunit
LRFPGFEGEWERKQLSDCCEVYDGTHQTPKYTKSGIPFVSVEDITALRIIEKKFISEDDYKRDFKIAPQAGDILMTRIGDIGTSRVVTDNSPLAYYVSVALLRPIGIEASFLNSYIPSPFFKRELYRRTIHVAFPQKINKEDIGKCLFAHPSIVEQSKIGSFLNLLDQRIDTQSKLIEDLRILKKAIMARLFQSSEGEMKTLGELTVNFSNRNKQRIPYPMFSVTNDKGFIPQSEQFEDREMEGEDIAAYKLIHTGDIAYNPARINVGSIAQYKGKATCMISSLYVCIKAKKTVSDRWLMHILKSERLLYYYNLYAEGGVRLYLFYPNFSRIKVFAPPYAKQEIIADCLDAIEKKVEQESVLLNDLMKQKQFFLSRLFL